VFCNFVAFSYVRCVLLKKSISNRPCPRLDSSAGKSRTRDLLIANPELNNVIFIFVERNVRLIVFSRNIGLVPREKTGSPAVGLLYRLIVFSPLETVNHSHDIHYIVDR